MSGDIVLSAALRNNLLSLQSTQRNIDTTQLRLATGLKVNSALDNPQNFFTAKALNNRASDLTRLLDGISQSIRTIEQANTGVETLSQLLDQADSIALEAQSEIRASEGYSRIRGNVDLTATSDLTQIEGGGVITAGDQFNVQVVLEDGTSRDATITIGAGENVDDIVSAINTATGTAANDIGEYIRARVTDAGQLEFASLEENAVIRISNEEPNGSAEVVGQAISNAGLAALGLDTVSGTENDGTAAGTRQGGTAIAGNVIFSQQLETQAASGVYEASQTLADGDAGFLGATATEDVTLTFNIDGESVTVGTFTETDTVQDVIDGINNSGNSDISATFNADDGRIEIEFSETVGQVEIQFTANAASDVDFGFASGASDEAGLVATEISSELVTFDGVNPDVDQYEEDFNNIRDQIDQLVEDSNYRGVNLLAGDNLETFFNEDRDNSLKTEGVDFTALGLGIVEGDFTNAANVQQSIDQIRSATLDVRNFGQSIANDLSVVQFRRDFTEQTINTLKSGADDLVVADQNEEGANLLALQTRQALGTTSLSLAAQSQQAVLRLF